MEVVTIPVCFFISILHFINQEVVVPPKPFLSAQFNGFQCIHTYVWPLPWSISTRVSAFGAGGGEGCFPGGLVVRLPMQGAWVPSLVRELDPTCCY